MILIALVGKVIYSYAFQEKSALQMCQESYMKALNEVYRENEKTAKECVNKYQDDIYKLNKCTSSPLPLPENKC